MAVKRFENKNTNGGGGRVKFRYADPDRYVDLDVSNVDQSVAEELRSLVSSLTGRHVIQAPRTLAAPKTTAAPVLAIDQTEIAFPTEPEQKEQVEQETPEEEPTNGNGSKRSYNFKPPTFLNDLDVNKATKPLKDFIEAKNPTDVMDKYLVVAFWLQKYLNVEEVTVDHIYTVFDHLGWKGEMPVKPGKPLADLKSKRHMLTREQGAAGYKVNFKGEQFVENMGAKK